MAPLNQTGSATVARSHSRTPWRTGLPLSWLGHTPSPTVRLEHQPVRAGRRAPRWRGWLSRLWRQQRCPCRGNCRSAAKNFTEVCPIPIQCEISFAYWNQSGCDIKKPSVTGKRPGGMILKLSDVDIIGFKTAISVSHGTDVEYTRGKIIGSENGVIERDPPSFLEMLGLPADTPFDALLIALMTLRDRPEAPLEEKTQALKTSKIGPYLQHSANAATVVQGLALLATSPEGTQVITWLKGVVGF